MTPAARPRVVCLDDEPNVLESLRDTLRRHFELDVTTNGFEALRMLAANPCAVVLSDVRMPLLNGVRFMALARKHAPETVRVMLTGHSAIEDAAAAVNDGQIYRLLIKPCAPKVLIETLQSAAERHDALILERNAHLASREASIRALLALAAQVDRDGPARGERIRRQAVELATRAEGVAPSWDLERAAELMQLGTVALSPEVRARLSGGARISQAQSADLERLPELAEPLLTGLRGLEDVTAMLRAMSPASRRGGTYVPELRSAAAVLRIVLDFELLERQEVPIATALRAMRDSGRYDPAILASFSELIAAT